MARGRRDDVIELSDSDSDSDSDRARPASPSRHLRPLTEWAFLESPSASSANDDDSDDFAHTRSSSKAQKKSTSSKNKTKKPSMVAAAAAAPRSSSHSASSTPVKKSPSKTKKKQQHHRPARDEEDDDDEDIDERPKRVAVRHLFSDHLTMSELQAQERELKRWQRFGQKTNVVAAASSPRASKSKGSRSVENTPRSPKRPVEKTPTPVVRAVLATTLARKQLLERSPSSSPVVAKKPSSSRRTKRRLEESEEDEEEEEQAAYVYDDSSDDFVDDIVEAKKAALRASQALAKKAATTTTCVLKKTVLAKQTRSRSPSTSPEPEPKSKSKSKKKAAPPSPKTSKKSPKAKPPPRKQPKLSVPVVKEPRRRTAQAMLSEQFSLSELQAQEREWARLQRDLKFMESTTPTKPETKAKLPPTNWNRSSRSTRQERANSVSSSDMSLVEIVELIEEDDEDEENDDGDFIPQPIPVPKKSSSKKASRSNKRPAQTQPKPAAPAAPRDNSLTFTNGKRMDVLPKPRIAADTVPHWTTWRALSFRTAPANLLAVPPTVAPPFESAADRPLGDFDTSNELDAMCQILVNFGKTKTFLLSNAPSKPELSQDAMNERVAALLETWMPHIKRCYDSKSDTIMQEARGKIAEYVRLRDENFESIVQQALERVPQLQCEKLPVCKAERALAKQLLQPKVVSPLDVMGTVKVCRGDSFLVEKEFVPDSALELSQIRPISRSTTYTGVKASVRVDDDPILRFVPYFGDNDDGDAIDVKAYDNVRAKQAAEGAKSSNGLDNEAHEYMLRLVIAECGDQETVFDALKQVAGFAQPYTEYMEIKKRRDAKRTATKRMEETKEFLAGAESTDVEGDETTRRALRQLTSGLHPFSSDSRPIAPLAERLASQLTYFDTNLIPSQARGSKGFRRLLGLRHTDDYADLSETYRDLFCRMCYKYDCHDHGIEHPMPTRRVDPLYPATRFAPVVTNGENENGKAEANHEAEEADNSTDEKDAAVVTVAADESVQSDDEDGVDPTQATDLTDLASESSATTAESQETIDLSASEPRRSSRMGTRASTLATISVESQLIAQGFKPRSQRVKAPTKKRPNGDESEYLDDSHTPLISTKVKSFLKAGVSCSATCWKANNSAIDESTAARADAESTSAPTGVDAFTEPEEEIKARLNAPELLVLQKLRHTVGDNACMIASVLQSLSCRDIHTYLVSQQRSKPVDQQGYFSPDVGGKKNRKRGRATAALPGNNRELLKRTRHQRLKDTSSANHDYEPCNHEGICDFGASCSCMKRDHMCEKACSCSRDCPNRFQGCRCSMGNCRTNQCPCFVALRECNPDLCVSCGASDVPVLVHNPEFKSMSSQELGICCNMNVQRGLHKRIGVSYSRTHGWGAFALEPIKKNEFIYEYVGAIISHDEAERRGTIYDKLNISFLFDLNEDSVADAIRTGNKSKFCNHLNAGHKCFARIFRVGGEHHISIWAQTDIQKGEELFFNYGYHGESAPVWSQGARITESSKREAAEAVEEILSE